ncbi:MAG: efflux RND transporter periplasmic adaptor subunit [Deltaproteobacteria bacterium]|nr:efflux RND transporter periplasmic adaptor subunit [Deltaproteobacteria bacterium]
MRKKGRLRLSVAASAALLCLFINYGCSKDAQKTEAGGARKGAQAQAITTVAVEGRAIERSVEATGTLAALDEVVVSNEGPGTVGRIIADLGDRVEIGAHLAVLDQREARLGLAQAQAANAANAKTVEKERARYVDAKTSLERYAELFRQEMVSQSQYDLVKTQFDVAFAQFKEAESRLTQSEAYLDIAKKRLSDTTIVSPIEGVVKKRLVSPGESLRDKTPMFTIVSSGPLKFRGTVPESAVPEIAAGQKIRVTVDAFQGREFTGTLSRVSPAVDVETRSLDVEAIVPNPGNILKPGYFAKGVILTRHDEAAPFAPESAIYSFVGITKVFVIENGTARERMVRVGRKDGGMTEIIGDVKPGDVIASSNLANLYEGVPVTVGVKK